MIGKCTARQQRIGIIAGELSGDLLGGGLILALRARYPNALIEGIGGPRMLAAGFHSHYPLETLSVMGLVEVVKHYPRLLLCRNKLRAHFLANPPNVFIGIDAPDFNLGLEAILKSAGIPTVHYVSPSVWAWRQYRLKKIAKACNLMLALLPFEAQYYQQHDVSVQFVGHPLADEIPFQTDKKTARIRLGLNPKGIKVALLPGSRISEVEQLGIPFLHTVRWLLARRPNLEFIVPLANVKLKELFSSQLATIGADLPLIMVTGQARDVMAAADVVLMASGTATLEAMLLKRPMVVAYRLAQLTYWLAKRLVNIPHFSLPNLLAQKQLVPEFLQDQVLPEQLGAACLHWLDNPHQVEELTHRFIEIHHSLRLDASQQAAQAITPLISQS